MWAKTSYLENTSEKEKKKEKILKANRRQQRGKEK